MTTIYIKQNEVKITIEVTEQVAETMKEARRAEWRNDAKEKYHNSSLTDMESTGKLFGDKASSAEELMVEREERVEQNKKLRSGMDNLTPEQRKIIKMRFVERMELTEIAEELGITYQAVQQRLKTILKKLKKLF